MYSGSTKPDWNKIFSITGLGDPRMPVMRPRIADQYPDLKPKENKSPLYPSTITHSTYANPAMADRGKAPKVLPLPLAVSLSQIDKVRALLSSGEDVNTITLELKFQGLAPIHIAVDNKDYEMVEFLVARGADVNLETEYSDRGEGETPLFIAITVGSTPIVDLLITHGARLDQPCGYGNHYGKTPLINAVVLNDYNMVYHLIKLGANVNQSAVTGDLRGLSPLFCAVINKYDEIARLLIKNQANINYQSLMRSRYPRLKVIEAAVKYGSHDIIIDLIRAGVDVNQTDLDSPILFAVGYGRLDVVNTLITNNAKVEVFISFGANKGLSSLALATVYSRLNIIPVLLKAGAAIDTECRDGAWQGMSALHIAVITSSVKATLVLLDHRANVFKPCGPGPLEGKTPLELALEKGHAETTNILRDKIAKLTPTASLPEPVADPFFLNLPLYGYGALGKGNGIPHGFQSPSPYPIANVMQGGTQNGYPFPSMMPRPW